MSIFDTWEKKNPERIQGLLDVIFYLSCKPKPPKIIVLIFSNREILVFSCLASSIKRLYSFCFPGVNFSNFSLNKRSSSNAFCKISGMETAVNYSDFISFAALAF